MNDHARSARHLLQRNPFIRQEELSKTCLDELHISAVTADSTLCKPHALFVATHGATKTSKDGHDFIDDAILKGASLVIVDHDFQPKPQQYSVPIIRAHDSKSALCYLVEAFFGFPSSKLKIIGITGTNGKTSTSFMVHSILKHAGFNPKIMGTLGMGDPGGLTALTHTTMAPEFISAHLAAMAQEGVTHVIMEVSSHALSLKRVEAIDFYMVGLTNITEDHLDFHGDMMTYQKAKSRLFFDLAREDTSIVLPDHHPFGHLPKATLFGENSGSRILYSNIDTSRDGVAFSLAIDGIENRIKLPLFGDFQVANASLAAAICLNLGIEIHHIKQGLLGCCPIPGRLELIANRHHRLVVVDFAHTPDALLSLLRSVRPIASGRLYLVFGCGGQRDAMKRPHMGRLAEELADFIIVTDDNPRSEDPASIRRQIFDGMRHPSRALEIGDRRAAITHAIVESQKTDVVVIAGKGHENYQIYKNASYPFSDQMTAKEILDSL